MRKIGLVLLTIITLVSCNNTRKKTTTLSQLIPESSQVILKINQLESFKSDITNNDLITSLTLKNPYKKIKLNLEQISKLQTDSPVIVCIETLKDSVHYTIITKQKDSLTQNLKSIKLHSKIIDSIYVASTSKNILSKVNVNTDEIYSTYFKTTRSDKSFSLVLTQKTLNHFSNSILDQDSNQGQWLTLDTNLSNNLITINGIINPKDSIPYIFNVFDKNIPQENSIQNLAPEKATNLISLTFSDYSIFNNQLNKLNIQTTDSTNFSEIFETINEVGKFNIESSQIVAIHSLDENATSEVLNINSSNASVYRDIPIYKYSKSQLFSKVFRPFFKFYIIAYFYKIDIFFVFSKNETGIETLISKYQNGSTLANARDFKSCFENLSDESSILVFKSEKELQSLLNSWFKTQNTTDLNAYKLSAFQFIIDDDFTHFNAVINKHNSRHLQQGISEEFSIKLESDLLTTPQFVKNHKTNQKDVIVQDVNNKLYLISNTGKVLWSKALQGKILGEVSQIDLFKNGRLQLAFATTNRVYVLDRNGKNVAPFPVKLNDVITQPLSIFDYDNTKNYRFLITQGENVLMLDKNAKKVNGFNYNANSEIIKQPQHFRLNNKDYIVFAEGNTMRILNRRGQNRISVKEDIAFSGNLIFLYQNKFTSSTTDGKLVQVNLNGAVSHLDLGLETNHKIDATSKTLVTLSENKLTIKQKTYELDFGNYSKPKIFYINDKIYVSVTDLQAKKVFVFDSQAVLQNHFPVYGNALIDLDNIDRDNYLEFVTIGDNNSIIVYQKK